MPANSQGAGPIACIILPDARIEKIIAHPARGRPSLPVVNELISHPPAFHAFSPEHLIVLAFVAGLTSWFIITSRRNPGGRILRRAELILAMALALNYPASIVIGLSFGILQRDNWLPLHLCDAAALTAAWAIWKKSPRAAELAWFWGMAGTLNGLLTPNLLSGFPHPAFFCFFWLHGLVVVASLHLACGRRLHPQPGGFWRALGSSQVYLVIAGLVDWLAGTNYAFLREKPAAASLIDHLGPWPWYILALEGLAVVFFLILHLPFALRRKISLGSACHNGDKP